MDCRYCKKTLPFKQNTTSAELVCPADLFLIFLLFILSLSYLIGKSSEERIMFSSQAFVCIIITLGPCVKCQVLSQIVKLLQGVWTLVITFLFDMLAFQNS